MSQAKNRSEAERWLNVPLFPIGVMHPLIVPLEEWEKNPRLQAKPSLRTTVYWRGTRCKNSGRILSQNP